MEPTLTTPVARARTGTETLSSCTHGRMVDEVRTPKGIKTGELICMECLAKFPDPMFRADQKKS